MITPEEIADEEARAALWRTQAQRRVAYQAQLWASLAGSPAAAAQFWANWRALIEWVAEGNEPTVDPCDDADVDPLGISDSVNVGR